MKYELLQISRKVMKNVIALKPKEDVLIITNPEEEVNEIARSLEKATIELKGKTQFLVQPKKDVMDFAEDYVIHAIEQEPDIIIIVSTNRTGKDRFRINNPIKHKGKIYDHIFDYLYQGKKSIRGFWSPTITKDIYLRCVDIDYKELRKRCKFLKDVITDVDEIQVRSRKGTNIVFSTEKRKAYVDDGDFRKPGKAGNIPCGEVFISPSIASGDGRIVFDGSLSYSKGSLILKNPVVVDFKDGYVFGISGKEEANIFRKDLEEGKKKPFELFDEKTAQMYARNAEHLGEFGIGLNPKAKIVGNILEDEKVMKTVHFAIGSNYDQDAKALIHYDGLVINPTISVNRRTIIKNGRLLMNY